MTPDSYPDDLVQVVVLPDDTPLHIRPLRRCERKAVRELFDRLSLRTRYLRFLSPLRSLPESLVDALSCVDYRRTLALVAEREAPDGREIVAFGSFGAVDDHNVEVGLVVRDDWQKRRVGTELAGRVIAAAEARGYRRFIAHVTTDNLPIRRILNRVGDVVSARSSGGVSELAFVAHGVRRPRAGRCSTSSEGAAPIARASSAAFSDATNGPATRCSARCRLLSDGDRVAEVATAVGYESEAAFSRGFKKIVGRPPSAWRAGPERTTSSM